MSKDKVISNYKLNSLSFGHDIDEYKGNIKEVEMRSSDLLKEEVEMVSIPKTEYESLLKRDDWLACLEQAGVDNWSGWDYACELRDEEE